jgi:RNase P/RNase MRP subunit p30
VDQQLEIYLDRYIIKLIKLHEVYINLSLVYLLKFEITIIF